MNWFDDLYPWLKVAHLFSVIAWMAGIFYLPRLFVYHAEAAIGSDKSETFKLMERRLYRGIMNPAMIATYLFGLMLAGIPGVVDWSLGWIWVKLAAVLVLTGIHILLGRWRTEFAADRNHHPERFFRIVNEIPTVLLILILVMVIVKPF